MIEIFVTVIISFIIGYIIRGEKVAPVDDILKNQVIQLEQDIVYYKKLTKGLVEENADMRARLRKHGEKYE